MFHKILSYFYFLILVFIGWNCHYALSEPQDEIDETLETRLAEIPKRLKEISQIAYPDGIPKNIIDFYTLPYVKSSTCGHQSYKYRKALKEFQSWAVQMVDSSGKIPSGILQGNFHDMGNYDECMETAEKSPYPIQYCLVQFGNIIRLPKHSKINWEKEETAFDGVPILNPRLNIGFCLPTSCKLNEITENYKKIVDKYNMTVYMDKYSCTTSDELNPPWSTFEIISVLTLSIPVVISIIGALYNFVFSHKGNGKVKDFLDCFSMSENARNLFKPSDSNQLSTLNGLRFLTCLLIFFGHHFLLRYFRPALNYLTLSQLHRNRYIFPFLGVNLIVNSFIVIHGLLLSYSFFDNMKKGKKFNVLFFYFNRIARILPTYIAHILLLMTVFIRYYSSGPLSKTYCKRHTENCYKNWWTNFLFINNYVNAHEQCIPTTWFLSVFMQLNIISPIFLFAFLKWKSFIKFGIPSCIAISISISFMNSYLGQLPAGSLVSRDFSKIHRYQYDHITTHTRLSGWFLGLGLGYVLYNIKDKQIMIRKIWVVTGWILCATIGTGTLFLITHFHQDYPYSPIIDSLYTSFSEILWALCISWIIFACETGYGNPLKGFLSCRIMQVLGRLNFIMYMSHIGLQYGNGSRIRQSDFGDQILNTTAALGEYTATVICAPLLSLFYEAPFIRLAKLILFEDKEQPDKEHDKES